MPHDQAMHSDESATDGHQAGTAGVTDRDPMAVRRRARAAAILAGVSLTMAMMCTAVAQPAAQSATQPREDVCSLTTGARVVAVGDVHGAFDKFVTILRAARLIDTRNRWIGGGAILVQVGDLLDRGNDSKKAIDLLRRLERDAPRAGGRVYTLVGNHEFMRLAGDWRYVSDGELRAFSGSGKALDKAFSPAGEYGAWVRRRPAAVRINGILYLHGGVSERNAELGCEGINAAVQRDLDALPVAPEQVPGLFSAAADGPLWFRGMATEPESSFAPAIDRILAAVRARAVVIGHTAVLDGQITPRFGGRVWLIDTGMLEGRFFPGGIPSALEIHGDAAAAIYERGREPLTLPPARGQN